MANGSDESDQQVATLDSDSPLVPSRPNDAAPHIDPEYAIAPYVEKPPTKADRQPQPPRHYEGEIARAISPAEEVQREAGRYQDKLDRWNAQQMYEGQQTQLREINRQTANTFREQHVATQRNPETGLIEPIRDDEGNIQYHPGRGPVTYDESGHAVQMRRVGGAGPAQVELDKEAPIDTHPDRPNELYKQNKYAPWEYLGTVQEGMQSSDQDVQKSAQDAQLKLDKRLHGDTGNDLGQIVAKRALDVSNKV